MTLKEKIEFIRQAQVYREEIEDKLGYIFRDNVGRLVVYGDSLLAREERYDEDSAYYNISIDEFIEKVDKEN